MEGREGGNVPLIKYFWEMSVFLLFTKEAGELGPQKDRWYREEDT